MRVSIGVTNFSWPAGPGAFGSELTRLVAAADRVGVDTVWVADHLLQADPTAAPDQTEMYEAYTVLGYAAARSGRVRLGTCSTSPTAGAPSGTSWRSSPVTAPTSAAPYEAVEKTLSTRLEAGESSDEFVRRCRAAAALGIEHVAVITPGPWKPERLATLAAAIPTLREVQP